MLVTHPFLILFVLLFLGEISTSVQKPIVCPELFLKSINIFHVYIWVGIKIMPTIALKMKYYIHTKLNSNFCNDFHSMFSNDYIEVI